MADYKGEFMKKGKIIFLNGLASSGKTTLSKTLQAKLDEPYYWLNVDEFIGFSDANPQAHNPMTYFEKGKDPVSIFPHIIKCFSDMGVNVIADAAFVKGRRNLFLAEETLNTCIEMFHDYPLLYVHVTCPPEEIKRREEKRFGCKIDADLSRYEETGTEDVYDVTVDTFQNTMEECADKIIEHMKADAKQTAFSELWSQTKSTQ